ncbi:MAG TPA: hypothetical protein VHH73_20850, partial [Verrucomicrobiae bacterium]|nr:hypothetical protein [Verrucomicrobiae bacterium]
MSRGKFWLRQPIWGVALLLAGCHVPTADITTSQDQKYPLSRQSKIGFPNAELTPSLNARLADELAQKQMVALGFNIVPLDQADYVARADERRHELTVSEDPGGPSMGTTVGGGSGGLFTGVGFSIPLGSPQTVVIHRTELDVAIETAQSPKLVVWQGKIVADVEDRAKYQGPFFRALLARVGATFDG